MIVRPSVGNRKLTDCWPWAGAVLRGTGTVISRRTCCLPGWPRPLVLSVHTVVSFDFSIAIVPGWHTTIFPPYFVAGAIYSGFAMVLTIAIPLRKYYHFEDFITMRHLENMAKVMLATGLIVAYGYFFEFFMSHVQRPEIRCVSRATAASWTVFPLLLSL